MYENICIMDVISLKVLFNVRNCIFFVFCFLCNCMIKNNVNVVEKIFNLILMCFNSVI